MAESGKPTSNRRAPASQIQNTHALVYFFSILQSLRIVSKSIYFETTHIITKRYLQRSFHHADDDEFVSRLLFGRHPNLSDYEWNLLRPLRRRRDVILQRYLCRGAKHVPDSVDDSVKNDGKASSLRENGLTSSGRDSSQEASKTAPKPDSAPKRVRAAIRPAKNKAACVDIEMSVVDESSNGLSCTSKEPKCEKQQVGSKPNEGESSPTTHVTGSLHPSAVRTRGDATDVVAVKAGNGAKHKMTTSESESNVVSDGGSRGAKPRKKMARLAKSSSTNDAVENVPVTKSSSVFLEEIASGLKASFSDIVKTSLSVMKDEIAEISKVETSKLRSEVLTRLNTVERQCKQVLNRNEQLKNGSKVIDYYSSFNKSHHASTPSMADIFEANCILQGTGGAKSKQKKRSSNVK